MLSTPHLLSGAAVGAVGAPFGLPAVFALAFISHIVLDMVPHSDVNLLEGGENDKYTRGDFYAVALEIVIAIVLVIYFAFRTNVPQPILIGAVGGFAIDVIDNMPYWQQTVRKWPFFKQLHQLHDTLHTSLKERGRILGVVTQFIVIIISVIILMQKK